MAAEKKSRRIKPVELLEMLDLDERKVLASEIGLTPPENLKDQAFVDSIAAFSATTLLQKIVRLRSPIIEMLKEVYQFLETEEARGRTTVRAVVLPGAKDDLQLLFNSSMEEAIAIALDRRIMSSSIDMLEEQIQELKDIIIDHVESINGTHVRYQTKMSRAMRSNRMDPMGRTMARQFDKHRTVYQRDDRERVQAYAIDFSEFVEKCDRLIRESGGDDRLPTQIFKTVLRELQEGMDLIESKLQDMNAGQPNGNDLGEPREEINEDEWQDLLEKTQGLKEDIFASCRFQTNASLLCDFLNLDLWRERWRIYEPWMLTHLLQLFQHLGFTVDIGERVVNGLWNLKFTKDKKPVAMLRAQSVNLEVYYQLYSKEAEGGNMPDLAIKKEDGKYLIVLDPKYGESYGREELEKVGLRYANSKKFSPQLTVIHNFYTMPSYRYEVIQDSPRCLLVSNLRPGSTTTSAIDGEIIALIPHDWLPARKSVFLLVDVSGSIQKVQERIVQAVEKEFQKIRLVALPNSTLMLFSDRVDREIPFSEVRSIHDALNVSGAGTDLTGGISAAIEKMKAMPMPRILLIFTDGEDSFDIAFIDHIIRSAEVQLRIYEAADLDKPTLLQELARISGSEYKRI
ncbi:MAG TPA: vWA domain-containing protein [Ktedonobacteraceae bacterium]|nr:vWA domain-containing protein [Ktedonobacteraceae bacterium]